MKNKMKNVTEKELMMEKGKEAWEIRQADRNQIEEIMAIYERARNFMAEHGNPTQWVGGYPSKDMILGDIEAGYLYVCMAGERIGAVFYYREGEDADYGRIWDGAWLDEEPYGVVHRIASAGIGKGAAFFCLSWALEQCGNVRIDTHRDNVVMQNLLNKSGFTYCGIIHVRGTEERMAYQRKE